MKRFPTGPALALAALGFAAAPAHAQMVSAADMGFFTAEVAHEYGYAQAGYTFASRWAAGPAWYRIAGDGPEFNAFTANVNWLAWRENARDWQANLYVGAGAGGMTVSGGRDAESVGAGLVQADWEDRRWHIMYQGQALFNDRRFHLSNTIHAGWAPWLAEYDEVAPWLYLRANYITDRSHNVDFGPMIALMYKSLLVEAGVDLNGKPMYGIRYLFSF